MTKRKNSSNIEEQDENLKELDIFKQAKEEIAPIQQNLIDKKITIDEAKQELKSINDKLQLNNIEAENNKDKENLKLTLKKILELEQDIDENILKEEIWNLIDTLELIIKWELKNLKRNIIKNWQKKWKEISLKSRPVDIQEWIEESSDNFVATIEDASKDKNRFAWKIGKLMKRLIS